MCKLNFNFIIKLTLIHIIVINKLLQKNNYTFNVIINYRAFALYVTYT